MADDPYYFDRVVPLATGVPEDPVHHDPEKHPYWGEYEEPGEEDLAWGDIIVEELKVEAEELDNQIRESLQR